ncbi:hypothetical protein MON38_10650 [Hymenobacter sp. DH14]|uniref:Uncharacterized protein n=1 Tax=Hymenobacter cyanobacteriorum TaxID=2926463 RepID=A0A9X1VJ08_9BACT|nr:hypothetical protein [Hymenobacter cyanobacteriorum]MCI1187880.1 hypothetical protein [Hymenobacter cyanobacteriorum]
MYQVPTFHQFEALVSQVKEMAVQIEAMQADSNETLARTYHLGMKPTPGRGYNDRLVMRIGFCEAKIRQLLKVGPIRGGIRHRRVGNKYIVSEAAVREFFGD